MNPNATLADLVQAACEGDISGVIEATTTLNDWIHRGGHPPTLEGFLEILHERDERLA